LSHRILCWRLAVLETYLVCYTNSYRSKFLGQESELKITDKD